MFRPALVTDHTASGWLIWLGENMDDKVTFSSSNMAWRSMKENVYVITKDKMLNKLPKRGPVTLGEACMTFFSIQTERQ